MSRIHSRSRSKRMSSRSRRRTSSRRMMGGTGWARDTDGHALNQGQPGPDYFKKTGGKYKADAVSSNFMRGGNATNGLPIIKHPTYGETVFPGLGVH